MGCFAVSLFVCVCVCVNECVFVCVNECVNERKREIVCVIE